MTRRIAALLITLTLAVACLRGGQARGWARRDPSRPASISSRPRTPRSSIRRRRLRCTSCGSIPTASSSRAALSNDEVMEAERVDGIAKRRKALAAVNAGFFNVKNGEPAGC